MRKIFCGQIHTDEINFHNFHCIRNFQWNVCSMNASINLKYRNFKVKHMHVRKPAVTYAQQ